MTTDRIGGHMPSPPDSGRIFGIPYNFKRPSIRRLFSSYWQPGEGMLVEKPFGIGYTLNLANWRSWIVLGVAGVLFYLDRGGADESEQGAEDPVEIVVDEDDE